MPATVSHIVEYLLEIMERHGTRSVRSRAWSQPSQHNDRGIAAATDTPAIVADETAARVHPLVLVIFGLSAGPVVLPAIRQPKSEILEFVVGQPFYYAPPIMKFESKIVKLRTSLKDVRRE
jgi:hypothetical protein